MGDEDLFSLSGVTVRKRSSLVLDEVSMRIPAGRCTVLRGASGAGKSTLLRLLIRLDDPASGHIVFRGTSVDALDVLALRRRVQLVPQQPVLLTDSVADELRAGAARLRDDEADTLLAEVGLPPDFRRRSTSGLSGGEAARVCLARALALRPEALLLDEPTSALDAVSTGVVVRTLRDFTSAGGTVVLVSHDDRVVDDLGSAVFTLHRGRVSGGGRDELGDARGGS